eukprot:1160948-Pelagomonas_calceolata.AAC.6
MHAQRPIAHAANAFKLPLCARGHGPGRPCPEVPPGAGRHDGSLLSFPAPPGRVFQAPPGR